MPTGDRFTRFSRVLFAAAALLAMDVAAVRAQADVTRPQRHFKVQRPAALSDADAISIYDQILDELVRGYGLSGLDPATDYRNWRRYNTAPYRSATHGNRYVNNYANATARAYQHFERSGPMPEGSVLVKDSFAVTQRGDVTIGPLFLMRKMASGFGADTGDWRYTMIMPDGSVFGVTNGEGAERVRFCADCHNVVGAKQDHRFFVPEKYRTKFLDVAPKSE